VVKETLGEIKTWGLLSVTKTLGFGNYFFLWFPIVTTEYSAKGLEYQRRQVEESFHLYA
jgi:hypothetical protein